MLGKSGDYEAMDRDMCGLCSDYDKSFYCLFSRYYHNAACLLPVNTHPFKMKIPLNPPFSKGEISSPPLEKGGEGGFVSGFSDESITTLQSP